MIAIILALVVSFHFIGLHFQNNSSVFTPTRVVVLENQQLDNAAVFAKFDSYEIEHDGYHTAFQGVQTLDVSVFSGIDNVSLSEAEHLAGNTSITYDITYDAYLNIPALTVKIMLPDETVVIDTIQGTGFYNERGEFDAVMNIDGEGVLLSEMRTGMLDEVFLRRLVTAIIVVAVVVAVVAVVVATAGAAAPAVAAVGVGVVAGGTGTALAVAVACVVLAAVLAGVLVTADLINSHWSPGVARDRIIDGERVTEVDWTNIDVRTRTKEIARENERRNNGRHFFPVIIYNRYGPTKINPNAVTLSVMVASMRTTGQNSWSLNELRARQVVQSAFPDAIAHNDISARATQHVQPINANQSRVKVNGRTPHAWFGTIFRTL